MASLLSAMTNPNDRETQSLSRTHLPARAVCVFDTAPAAGARTATTAVTFPADSSLSTFHCFPCFLILITYCLMVVEATFFSGLSIFRGLIVAEKAGRLQLWSKRLELRDGKAFCRAAVLLSKFAANSSVSSALTSLSSVVTEQTSARCRAATAQQWMVDPLKTSFSIK